MSINQSASVNSSWKDVFPQENRYFETDNGILYCANNIEVLKQIADNVIDTVITDPPYGLKFMDKKWDYDVPSVETWQEILRVMKPGATLLSFAGSRTQHRMAVNVEDAGFILKDTLMWLYGCVSEDTEILTTEGWKNYKSISTKDIVFSFDTKKHKIVKSKVNQVFIYPYDDIMINLKNQNTDQLITPNHKVICKMGYRKQESGKRQWYKEDEWVYRDAWQIRSNQYTLPLASVYDGEWSIGGDFAEIIGWVLSEGNYQKDCNAVNIYQSSVNPDKVARIRYCLNRAEIKYSEYQRKRKYKDREYTEYQWYINGKDAKRIKEIIPDKKPTWKLLELKYSEKERLLKGLLGGDGSKGGNGKYQAFYQKDIEFLEWFQTLLHLTGKQGWINHKKYTCSIHYNDSTQIQGKHNKSRLVNYNGIVWSINTEIGNYIACRNGKIFITGNSGFPKATDISKQIDKKFGAKRDIIGKDKSGKTATMGGIAGGIENGGEFNITAPEAKLWNGYKSHGLKPAYEPIVMAIKQNDGSYADNALKWGVSGLNIDAGRIPFQGEWDIKNGYSASKKVSPKSEATNSFGVYNFREVNRTPSQGRFPANVLLDEESARLLDQQAPRTGQLASTTGKEPSVSKKNKIYNDYSMVFRKPSQPRDKLSGASRFFYVAKASKSERNLGLEGMLVKRPDGRTKTGMGSFEKKGIQPQQNYHPTVKPLKLIEYLIKLTSMPNPDQIYLDPFIGSGTTAIACEKFGKKWIGIELNEEYCEIAKNRIRSAIRIKRLI